MTNEEEIQSYVKDTVFVVEATHNEMHNLWRDHSIAGIPYSKNHPEQRRVKWEQISLGWLPTIGKLDGRPVTIQMFWARIEGRRVLFWEPTSEVVDHRQIKAWFKKNCTPPTWDGGRPADTNATNFHMCLHAIEEMNKRRMRVSV